MSCIFHALGHKPSSCTQRNIYHTYPVCILYAGPVPFPAPGADRIDDVVIFGPARFEVP